MPDEMGLAQRKPENEASVQHPPAEFDEAPGEAEADVVRDEFIKRGGDQPAGMAASLSSADGGTLTRAVSRLQQERGNGYVQRVVAELRGAPGRMVGLPQPEMVEEVQRRKDSGSPLAEEARQPLETHFGSDLGEVRVHTGGEATALNRELNAQAFTTGSDIFFAEGAYNPTSSSGQGLIAHELAHVSQQTGLGSAGASAQRAGVQRQEQEEDSPIQAAAPEAAAPEEETGL